MTDQTPEVHEALAVYAPETTETGRVPEGYKQTEVSVIPEDWEVSTLGSICVTSSGTTPSRSMRERYYGNGTIHWVKTMDLNNSHINTTEERVTPVALSETSLRTYPVGTVLIAMYGGFNQIGRTGLLQIPAAVNQAITAVQPTSSTLDPDYLLATLNFHVEHWKRVASSSRKDPNITGADIRAFQIAYPQIAEQRTIATALSDVDALISALDNLISKKRAVKTAAMQQLLTGKQRLPGFEKEEGCKQTELGMIPKDWEVKNISDIAEVKTGPFGSSLHESDYVEYGTPIVTVEHLGEFGIVHENLPLVSDSDKLRLKSYSLCENDVAFSRVGSIDRSSLVSDIEEGWLFSGRLLRVRVISRSVCPSYLSYHFHSKPFKERVRGVAVGQTMPSLNTQILRAVTIVVPSLREQTAIAAVLSDMDAEIEALEARREKTRQVKRGMMQELLTGRTRLV